MAYYRIHTSDRNLIYTCNANNLSSHFISANFRLLLLYNGAYATQNFGTLLSHVHQQTPRPRDPSHLTFTSPEQALYCQVASSQIHRVDSSLGTPLARYSAGENFHIRFNSIHFFHIQERSFSSSTATKDDQTVDAVAGRAVLACSPVDLFRLR